MSVPMMRFLLAACCALLSAWAPAADKGGKGGGGDPCNRPAECQINAQVYNFGRAQMSQTSPPVYSNAAISVTCTRALRNGLRVDVPFELKGVVVQEFPRQMRDIGATGTTLAYDMYVDPARTRLWGDGTAGTFPLQGACFLDDRNKVCTIPFLLYGTVFGGQSPIPPGQFFGAIVSRLEYSFSSCRP